MSCITATGGSACVFIKVRALIAAMATDLKVNRNPRRQSGRAVSNSGGSQGICENEVAPQVACCHLQSLQAGTYPLIKATIP
jgi:hypothetical protein